MMKSTFLMAVYAIVVTSIPLCGHDNGIKEKSRPKICLALSGGGARGAAHIGVLKVLEEYRIPIDCIAGTSMGALVGGAYASGSNIDTMQKLVSSLSTNALFVDNPPRDELNIRRKEEDYTLLFSPEMGLQGSVLPKGIVSGVQLETVLRKLAAPGYRDFDNLPIPYRAVATDLVSGKKVVFDKGEMAHAMRASMSVPVAIAPATVSQSMYVDGMLTENLPISVAQSMGADIVIAVNVGTPLLKKEQLGSITGVAGQMLSILTEQNVQKSIALLKPNDILISPELGDFATSDFDHLPQTISIGEDAARSLATKLAGLSLSPQEYSKYRNSLVATNSKDKRLIDFITFKDLKRVNPLYLDSLIETKVHQPIHQEILNQDLRRLYGTDDFEHVDYKIETKDDQHTLVINAVEKPWGPDYVRFGMGFNTDFQGDGQFALQGRLRKTWMNSYGAEWLSDIQVGSVNQIKTQWYQPLDTGQKYFIAPEAEFKQGPLMILLLVLVGSVVNFCWIN
jgi:NTE family protein